MSDLNSIEIERPVTRPLHGGEGASQVPGTSLTTCHALWTPAGLPRISPLTIPSFRLPAS